VKGVHFVIYRHHCANYNACAVYLSMTINSTSKEFQSALAN